MAEGEETSPRLKRAVRLAINPMDLERINQYVWVRILAGRIDLKVTEVVNPQERCSPLTCDILTAALAVDLLRNECRHQNIEPIRVYIFRTGWTRIPGTTVLREGTELNPKVFPVDEGPGHIAPPKVVPVIFRKRSSN